MRPGYQTLEFKILIVTVLAAALTSMAGLFDPVAAAWISTAATGLYTLARGLTKNGNVLARGWRSSEFWSCLLVVLGEVLAAASGAIPVDQAAVASAALGGALISSRSLAKTGGWN